MTTNKLPATISAATFLVVFARPACAAAFECPAFPAPNIEIIVDSPTDRVDKTRSLEGMRAAATLHHPPPVVGAYVGNLLYGMEIDDTVRQAGAGHFCAAPKYVKLKLALERTIYIPREFADDPCLAALARDHEAKHADAEVKAFDKARPGFEKTIREAIRRATKDAVASREVALGDLTREVQSGVNRVLDDMTALRERLDAKIESPGELERLRTSCGGRAVLKGEEC